MKPINRLPKSGWPLAAGIFVLAVALQAAAVVPTPGEESGYKEYSQHEAIARFLSRVAAASPEVKVRVVGRTRDVREYPSKDLYLVILSEEGAALPEKLNRSKPTVLITASQHGNEHSAKEAALAMIRDLAAGELRPLLKKVNVLVMPQTNPYGNFFDRRANELDLDMNRDHVKLETEGVAAIHRVFREWLPEVTIDAHEKGDDYYRVSIGCVSNINVDPRFQEFSRSVLLAEVDQVLAKKDIAFHEYLVTEEMGINTSAGAAIRSEDLRNREMMKRYSTTDINDGRNSLGIYQTLSFIQECSSRHDVRTLAARTRWQYAGLRSFLESVVKHAAEVSSMVRETRQAVLAAARQQVYLKMDYARGPKQPELKLKKFENADSTILGVLKADKRAGDTVAEEDLAEYPWPDKVKVVSEVIKNWFPRVEGRLSLYRPLGYIIPAANQSVVETLLRHGFGVQTFTQDIALEEEVYLASEVVPAKYDYLPPETLKIEKKDMSAVVKKGDYYVSCAQPGASLIPCLLEPQSDFGFIRYQALKLVPDKGGYFAIARYNGQAALPLIPYKGFAR
jgi:hypothetical protein